MSDPSLRRFNQATAVFAAGMIFTGWAVGPALPPPAPPEVARYTKEPLSPQTSSANAPTGQSQYFVQARDIPQEWWTLFRSKALNTLIRRALNNNPNLQSAMATLRAANQAVYAQEGKFFPLVEGNFNPTYNRTSSALTPVPANNNLVYQLHTAQLQVNYTLDVWRLNRRTVESLRAQADNKRSPAEAAYLTLVSHLAVAAIR